MTVVEEVMETLGYLVSEGLVEHNITLSHLFKDHLVKRKELLHTSTEHSDDNTYTTSNNNKSNN